jgi:iron complex transport system permease protein
MLSKPARFVGWTPLVGSSLALVIVIILAVSIGSEYIAPSRVAAAIASGVTGHLTSADDTIIWQMRLPRVLLAALVGAALAISGAAFTGGLLSVVCVFLLARHGRSAPLITLILAGVVIGSVLTAATSFLMLYSRTQGLSILSWLLGSFTFASWEKVFVMLPAVVVVAFTLMLSGRALNLLQLGEEQATQLGLAVEKFKLLLIVVATLATSIAVSVSGIIGFVGLIVPHAVRLAVGADYRRLVPLVAVLGAMFLVLADLLARILIAPSQLPIGIITSLVGGPFFLYLLRQRQREVR